MEPPTGRFIVIDYLRGFLMVALFIDHIQRAPGVFEFFTGGGFSWVSAAEGFFFLSGFTLSYVRGRQLATRGWQFVIQKIVMRSLQLYGLSVLLTLLFVAWSVHLGGNVGMNIHLSDTRLNIQTVRDALLLKLTYGWTDFLAYYAVFTILSPIALLLLQRKLWWLLSLISFIVYLRSNGDFDLAWQLLFFGGMTVGYHYKAFVQGISALPSRLKTVATYCLLLLSLTTYGASQFYTNSRVRETIFPHLSQSLVNQVQTSEEHYQRVDAMLYDRPSLAPRGVLLFILWFSTFWILCSRFQRTIGTYGDWLIGRLGRSSLLSFTLQGVVAYWIDTTWPIVSSDWRLNALYNVIALLGLYATITLWQALFAFFKAQNFNALQSRSHQTLQSAPHS